MQPFIQILLVLAFGLPLARGLQLTPLRAPSVRSRSTSPRLAEDSTTETSKGLEVGPLGELPILTLDERGDGWDDVVRAKAAPRSRRSCAPGTSFVHPIFLWLVSNPLSLSLSFSVSRVSLSMGCSGRRSSGRRRRARSR